MLHILKPKSSLILLAGVLLFFICLQSWFTYRSYQQETELLLKSLDESLRHSVIAYKTFSHNKERIEKLLPEAQLHTDTFPVEKRSENLIWDPDFESGVVMYSNCTKLPGNMANIVPNSNGWYWITNNPAERFSQWQGKGWGSKGSFMLIDGPMLNDQVVWKQQIRVQPGKTYCLRFWISSVALSKNTVAANEYWQQAFVSARINKETIGVVLAPPKVNKWLAFQATWHSGKDSLASIELLDLNTGSNYNDMGLDHLAFFETADEVPEHRSNTPAAIKPDTDIDLLAISTLFKDEMDLRNLHPDYQLEPVFSAGTGGNKKTGQLFSPEKKLATASYAISPAMSVRCVVESHTAYLVSRMGAHLILIPVSVFFSLLLLLLMHRYLVKQAQVSALKYEISNNITHELKTPVSTILAAIDMLQKHRLPDDPQKTEQYLDIARQQALKLDQLIDKAMEISRLESSDFKLALKRTDLKELIHEVLSSGRFGMISGASLRFHAEGTMFEAMADAFHLSNVLNTLLENAIRYCDTDPVIGIGLSEEKKHYRISITDNGTGIPKEYQQSVFEKYFRLPQSDRHNRKGYGLGLYYVKTIMDLHKGNVYLESDGKNGTCVTLVLNK